MASLKRMLSRRSSRVGGMKTGYQSTNASSNPSEGRGSTSTSSSAPAGESPTKKGSAAELEYKSYFILDAHKFVLPRRYVPQEAIGRGASGVVVAARDTLTNETVAIKRCGDAFAEAHLARRFLREIALLEFVDHPNVMGLKDLPLPQSRQSFDEVYMVLERMDADLHVVLHTQRLTPDHVRYFLYQLVCGVAYLHSASIIHRDLKPANLLVNSSCRLKIADLGLSRSVADVSDDDSQEALTEYVVTRHYRAPEIMLATRAYGPAIDMWSVGCIFAEMLRPGEILFPGKDYLRMLRMIFGFLGTDCELPAGCSRRARQFVASMPRSAGVDLGSHFLDASEEAVDLLRRLLTVDPAQRISAAEALRHPYFAPLFREEHCVPSATVFRMPPTPAPAPAPSDDAAAAATAAVPAAAAAAAGSCGGAKQEEGSSGSSGATRRRRRRELTCAEVRRAVYQMALNRSKRHCQQQQAACDAVAAATPPVAAAAAASAAAAGGS